MLWLGFAILALIALAFLFRPLLRDHHAVASRRAHDLAVYRTQLAEVDQELARGALSVAEADAARLEIQRRLLRADQGDEAAAAPRKPGIHVQMITAVVLMAVPLVAGVLYLSLGRPEAASIDMASARAEAEQTARLRQDAEQMIAQLRQRLEAQPDRAEGWFLLGRSLLVTERPSEAADAFGRAIALRPDDAEPYVMRGEALMVAADGSVTPAAQQDFLAALERNPEHPGARYYLGLARLQQGDERGAYDDWYALASAAPADASWLDLVQGRLRELAPRLGIPLAQAVPEPQPAAAAEEPGPSREQMDAAGQMSEEDRAAMVRGMVDRLAERLKQNPDDADGWLRLARAREVLGEQEAAREALRKAVALQPERVEARVALAFNLAGPTVKSSEPLPHEAVAEFAEVLKRAPDHAQALWFVGRGAYEAGDKEAAAKHWNRLLGLLPLGSPEARELADRIAGLSR